MVNKYQVVWDERARTQLRKVYEFIKKDSLQNANKVRQDILSKCADLNTNPTKYRADKFKTDKDIRYRAFEIHKIRVSFYIDERLNQVFILRVRNAKQEPLEY